RWLAADCFRRNFDISFNQRFYDLRRLRRLLVNRRGLRLKRMRRNRHNCRLRLGLADRARGRGIAAGRYYNSRMAKLFPKFSANPQESDKIKVSVFVFLFLFSQAPRRGPVWGSAALLFALTRHSVAP